MIHCMELVMKEGEREAEAKRINRCDHRVSGGNRSQSFQETSRGNYRKGEKKKYLSTPKVCQPPFNSF